MSDLDLIRKVGRATPGLCGLPRPVGTRPLLCRHDAHVERRHAGSLWRVPRHRLEVHRRAEAGIRENQTTAQTLIKTRTCRRVGNA